MVAPEPRVGIRFTDPPDPPAEVLARYGARVLDPATAAQLPDAAGGFSIVPGRTVYVADTLVVPSQHLAQVEQLLAAGHAGNVVGRRDPAHEELAERWRQLEPAAEVHPVVAVRLVSTTPGEPAPDAWSVLLKLQAAARAQKAQNPADLAVDDLSGVELQHLLFSTDPVLGGTPGTQGFGGEDASARVDNGLGGRRPVRVLRGPRPAGNATDVTVAILDTGLGENPELVERIRQPGPLAAAPIGLTPAILLPGAEVHGDLVGRYDGELDRCAGHGTFIAGVIRQLCPAAIIMPVTVMGSDGVALQADVVNALKALWVLATRRAGPPTAVHIVVLSMGYYTEQPVANVQAAPTGQLYEAIRELSARGVAVVAAAGNDATSRRLYPAAFAENQLEGGEIAVLSVGGLNLDGSVALFSNSGPWVRYWRCGVNVVSTFPRTFNGGLAPSVSTLDPVRPPRRGVDPDNFREGWGTWWGTSFSAPILAGELAQSLAAAEQGQPAMAAAEKGQLAQAGAAAARGRMEEAIEKLKEADPPEADPLEPPAPAGEQDQPGAATGEVGQPDFDDAAVDEELAGELPEADPVAARPVDS